MSAPKQFESIPAASAPVDLPRLVPSETAYRTGVVTGGVLGLVSVVLMVVGIAVTW